MTRRIGVLVRGVLLAAALVVGAACGGETREPVGGSLSLSLDYAALPQSRTAEGYYVLGEAGAPLVMQYYSDFL